MLPPLWSPGRIPRGPLAGLPAQAWSADRWRHEGVGIAVAGLDRVVPVAARPAARRPDQSRQSYGADSNGGSTGRHERITVPPDRIGRDAPPVHFGALLSGPGRARGFGHPRARPPPRSQR